MIRKPKFEIGDVVKASPACDNHEQYYGTIKSCYLESTPTRHAWMYDIGFSTKFPEIQLMLVRKWNGGYPKVYQTSKNTQVSFHTTVVNVSSTPVLQSLICHDQLPMPFASTMIDDKLTYMVSGGWMNEFVRFLSAYIDDCFYEYESKTKRIICLPREGNITYMSVDDAVNQLLPTCAKKALNKSEDVTL